MSSGSAPAVPRDVLRPAHVAGTAAAVLTLAILLGGLAYLQVPEEQQLLSPGREVLASVSDGAVALPAWLWLLAVQGLAGLGVVPAVSRRVGGADRDLLGWASTAATVGYAVLAVSSLLTLARLSPVVEAFEDGDPATRDALGALWPPGLDPWGLLSFGAVGVWVLAVSVVGLVRAVGRRGTWLFGLALGLGLLATTIGLAVGTGTLVALGLVVVTLAGTAWFGGLTALLFREPD
jgi:hypothetical protein